MNHASRRFESALVLRRRDSTILECQRNDITTKDQGVSSIPYNNLDANNARAILLTARAIWTTPLTPTERDGTFVASKGMRRGLTNQTRTRATD